MIYEPAHFPMVPSGRCMPGTIALRDAMFFFTPGFIDSGCYNPRYVAGTSTVSLHAEGRAIDVRPNNFRYYPGPWLKQGAAKALLHWCEVLTRHPQLGVQQIIFAGRYWRVGRGWRKLSPRANQHYDHAHIELTRAASIKLTSEIISNVLFPLPDPVPVPPNDPPPDDEENDDMFMFIAHIPNGNDSGYYFVDGIDRSAHKLDDPQQWIEAGLSVYPANGWMYVFKDKRIRVVK